MAGRTVVLSGFMATGKSTVGQLVASALGLPFVDTDALLTENDPQKRPTARIFAEDGEPRFRDREVELIVPLLLEGQRAPRVIALGGGAVTVPTLRHTALEHALVVTLTARPETIAARVDASGGQAVRPNLGARSPRDRARDLLALRREAYGECEATIATDDKTPEEIAALVTALAARDTVVMPLGTRSYAIELDDGQPEMLARTIDELSPTSVLVVTDENVIASRGAWLDEALGKTKAPPRETRVVLSPGEANKTIASVGKIWDAALAGGVDRQALVLAFGGGVVGDLAGFAASTLLRGVRCVQIATSLLAMVDSSVGGKTGFDHAAGKNLLGAFFQPTRVLLDLEHLTTLPPRERAAGLAEVVKIALVREPALLERLERDAESIARGDRRVLRDVVRESVRAKMRVVREDEHETGDRALLNLGHTIGHALETHGGYARWLHGEAVAIGSVLEIAATERLGLTAPGTAARASALFARFGLPTTATDEDVRAAWPYVSADKKRIASALKLPVVDAPGKAHVERVELHVLERALFA